MKKEKRLNHRGQVTIFIIIAIVIVVIALLIYSFYPEIKTSLGFGEESPEGFIQSCLEDEIKGNVEKLSLQGGSLEPEHYIMYYNEKIEYLCYTNEYYKTCVMQQPMLKEHIESEIENEIKEEVTACFNSLRESYQKKGYNVNMNTGETDVELLPKKIVITFDYPLTLAKGEDREQYDSFNVIVNNNLYELISVTNGILDYEVTYGDSEVTTYMDYYHFLKVEKKKQSDGSKIYVLTDRDSLDKFQFATRSLAWPPGYGD